MSLTDHIQTLRDRHAGLDTQIEKETRRPCPDTVALTKLKLQKLRLKDEIDQLEHNPPTR